uniref:Ion_trans domain-containing protein n=1 Tax=Macrostomum lignano TaxID=282301 RepID=A0A1I8FAX8_9PLAT
VYVFASMLLVVISIVCFVAETYEGFRVPAANCAMPCGSYVDPQHVPGTLNYNYDETEPHPVLINIDYALYALFVIEFIVRVFFAPSFRPTSPTFSTGSTTSSANAMNLRLLRGLRIVRILRIFKLVKHYNAFKILVYTIKISLRELMLMIVFLFVWRSDLRLHHSPGRAGESFKNIPLGLWWALVTMTTVGYGDFVPRQAAGYAIGCICVIFGVLTIAFTVPIVSRNKKPKEYWGASSGVPQKDLKKPTGIMAALSKFKKAPGAPRCLTALDLYGGGGGGDGAAGGRPSQSIAWPCRRRGSERGGGGGGQTTEDSSTLTAFAAARLGRGFFSPSGSMTPVQEVLDLDMDEARSTRNRQLLGQAQENVISEVSAGQRAPGCDALEKRKAALEEPAAPIAAPARMARSRPQLRKPFPANPARPGPKSDVTCAGLDSMAQYVQYGTDSHLVAGQLLTRVSGKRNRFPLPLRGLRVALSVAKIAVPLLRRVATALWNSFGAGWNCWYTGCLSMLSAVPMISASVRKVTRRLGGGGGGGGGWLAERRSSLRCRMKIGEAGREQPIEAAVPGCPAPAGGRDPKAPDGSSRRLLLGLVHPGDYRKTPRRLAASPPAPSRGACSNRQADRAAAHQDRLPRPVVPARLR